MPQVHGRRIKGAVCEWSTHQKRILRAVGENVVSYHEDFVNFPVDDTTGDPLAWSTTVVEAGSGTTTFASTDASGGKAIITTAGNEDDGGNYQLNGESFETTSDQDLYFGTKLAINDADQTDLFIGLAVTDTTLLGGVADAIYFESVDGSASLSAVTEASSTETQSDSVGTLADATEIELEFYWDGTTVEFFVDGTSVATSTTNIPATQMRVSVHFLTGEATANTCTIDWIRCIQIGR
ncbi:MAG: hypothetical protein Unbinned657contig1001_33 [Prokaryotic dsDNA virus sp.]|nr:MAG: hypothetical protein Unbinned657contig1001_33 [Prokaryotic dsDNA virus sp.]|tara:strand:+ start:235 stop:948 length:714 start_codon:yes stop_codon:yes gene_type:complete